MADATLQILGLGQGLVPLGYDVTGDQAMDLVAVKADFNGAAAVTDFVPMVQIFSPAGAIMAESQGSTVAAGGSATVTFAPFLRGQPAGGTYTPPRAFDTWRSDVRTIANGALQPLLWNPGNEFGPDTGLVVAAGAFDHLAVPVDCNLAVAMWVEVLTAMTAGGWYVVRYEMCENMTGGPVTLRQSSPHASAADQFPGPVAVSMTAPMVTTGGVFAQIQVQVENNDGAAAQDFRVNLATFANLG